MSATILSFAGRYAVTMRPYLFFVSGVTGLAGLAVAHASDAAAWILAPALLLSYGFGQALTDCFQTDTDALSSPYRPLVRGEISPRDVAVVSLVGLAACAALMTWFHPLNLALAGLGAAGLAAYTPFKRRPWAGPAWNAAIVVLLFAIGWLAGAGGRGAASSGTMILPPSNPRLLIGGLLAVFFGYADFVLVGYFKDVEADRATGYRTLPVVYGRRAASRVADLLATALLASLVLAFSDVALSRLPIEAGLPAAFLLSGGVAALAIAHWRLRAVRRDAEAHRAIAPVVHAYILLLSSLAAVSRPNWTPALSLLYGCFLVAMARRPSREQI